MYVKEQLGHSSIQVTIDLYGHLIPGIHKGAVNELAKATSTYSDTTHAQRPYFKAGEEKGYEAEVVSENEELMVGRVGVEPTARCHFAKDASRHLHVFCDGVYRVRAKIGSRNGSSSFLNSMVTQPNGAAI